MRSKWANITDHPIAIGAVFPAVLFLETAVMQTVHTNKKVPMASIKKADPNGKLGVTILLPNKKGGAAEAENK